MIRDTELLATTTLLRHALELLEEGLKSADPFEAVLRCLQMDDDVLHAGEFSFNLRSYNGVHITGAGKASGSMAHACIGVLGKHVIGGVVVVPEGQQGVAGTVELAAGGHPLPTPRGEAAARRVVELAGGLGKDDLLIVLISGGGSSLMSLPAGGVTLDQKVGLTREMLASGATIGEVNTVRKHLSAIKGGRLAALSGDATVLSLIASDVLGDRLDTIASGPTVPDPTTYAMAISVLEKYEIGVPPGVSRHLRLGDTGEILETPEKGNPCFANVHNLLVLPMSTALNAAVRRAGELGYNVHDLGMLEGESRETAVENVAIARRIASGNGPVMLPAAIISGGETTVTVRGTGRGGRNQEFALAAMPVLDDEMVLAAIGTDGIDGNSDAAGAIVDKRTMTRSIELGLDWRRYLDENDSHTFFSQTGNLILTGPTGTNVADLRVLLVGSVPENVITPAASNLTDEE